MQPGMYRIPRGSNGGQLGRDARRSFYKVPIVLASLSRYAQVMQETTFLITTDFHTSKPALEALDRVLGSNTYDAVLMLGDLINPRPREMPYVEAFCDLVTKAHSLPLFGLHGNNEPQEAWEYYRQVGINIHLETKEFRGYNICGIGGFGYLNEAGFEDLSVNNLIINDKTIFITHVPPRKTEAQTNGPLIHLFGHRHVLQYAKQLGSTLQVQCPAGERLKATELILPAKEVRFIDLH